MTSLGCLLAAGLAAADPSATVAADPIPVAPVASATTPSVSSTELADTLPLPESLTKLQVRRIYLTGAPEAALSLPDGTSRFVIEAPVGKSAVRMGAHYNFVNGKIEMWLTYVLAILDENTHLQVAASDVIGLGNLYYRQRFLERSRTVPLGISRQFEYGSLLLNAERTSWRLAPYDNPAAQEVGLIDAWGAEFTTDSDRVPDLIELLRLEHSRRDLTTFRYRRAFRGVGGDYHFDRADADARIWLEGFREKDEILLRGYWGQAWNIRPALPLRETFGLGGGNALKGYRFEEFRGPGALIGGTEYALRVPWTVRLLGRRVDFHEAALLFFGETGRIQDDWTKGLTPFKWSAGLGVRFKGRIMGSHKSVFRVYAAQAGEWETRKPIFYALADVG